VFPSPPITCNLGSVGTNNAIRVLAVDHNPLMREGLALLVRLQPDMQLVGAVATAEEAVHMYIEQRPDVTLMDLELPAEAALGAIRKIRARDAGARIIGLTTYEPDAAWARALAAGARQCVAKDGLSDSLPRLIRSGQPPVLDNLVPPENRG
jgi:DNA-binding NarL/FixJ family response regulator